MLEVTYDCHMYQQISANISHQCQEPTRKSGCHKAAPNQSEEPNDSVEANFACQEVACVSKGATACEREDDDDKSRDAQHVFLWNGERAHAVA